MASFSFFSDLITPTKYDVPDAPFVDVGQEQLDTQKGNAASFEAAKGLAGQFNDFMREQVLKGLRGGVTGFDELSGQLAKNLSAQLRGELTTSDAAASQRGSAAQALGLGIGGSPAAAALTARNLGLRQYQVQQQGQAGTMGYLQGMGALTRAPMFDFSTVFMTPQQRIATQQWNKANAFNVQSLKNQMAVQPEPWMKALAGLGDDLVNTAAAYYTGGLAGTGATHSKSSGLNYFGGGGGGFNDFGGELGGGASSIGEVF